MANDTLKQALEYAARGWRVLPLHSVDSNGVCTCRKAGCPTPGKHPRILEWQRRATTNADQISEWWGMFPDSNIGVATGQESGIVVLDVDSKSHGIETLKHLQSEYGEIADRVLVRTGSGGFHLYFKHPGGHWPNTQGSATRPSPIGQGIDFRGDGGLVVAPGSVHQNGQPYTWKIAPNGHMPVAPQWLLDRLTNRQGGALYPTTGEEPILQGNRHNTLRAWACSMRTKGMSKAAILAAISAENGTRFSEPKPNDEIIRLVEWVCQFQPGNVPDWRDVQEVPEVQEPTGLVSIRDVQSEVDALYTHGAQRGLTTGWPSLDSLYSVHPGDLTVIVAAPSAGKTTLGLNVVANVAVRHDWKIAICSTENRIPYMMADLAGIIAGETYYGNFKANRMDETMKTWVDKFLFEHFRFIKPTQNEPFTLEYVLGQARAMGADGLIIDPFGSIALPQAKTSNDSRVIRDLLHGLMQPFLKENGMHCWLMVHTTKLPPDRNGDMQMPNPYNATDSAGFFNAGDFCFGMRRPKSRGGTITELAVQKVRDRFSGQVGQVDFEFDYRTGRYVDLGIVSTAADTAPSYYDKGEVEF